MTMWAPATDLPSGENTARADVCWATVLKRIVAGVLLTLTFGQACSSGTGGGGSGGTTYTPNPALCEATCGGMLKSGCVSSTPSECQSDCEATREKYAQCLGEVDALLGCGEKSGYTCTGSGLTFAGCDAEQKALSLCGACIPVGSNGPCTICAKKACCEEYRAFGEAPDFDSYMECTKGCSDLGCLDACASANPVAAQAFEAVDGCRSTNCPSSCDGKPSDLPTDPVGRFCSAAAKAGCPLADCEANFGYTSDPTGCGPEQFDAITCAAGKPVKCTNGAPVFDESCTKALMDCYGPITGVGGAAGSGGAEVGGAGGGGGVIVGGAGGGGGTLVGGAGGGGGSGGSLVGGAGGAIIGGSGGLDGG